MQIPGEWYPCPDGVERPVILGEVRARDGSWLRAPLLLDTGADCTVFTEALLSLLELESLPADERLGGLGGAVDTVIVQTEIRLARDASGPAVFHGRYAAVTEPGALDMSVLGRDITGLFAVIVDRPSNVVCMVGQRHTYQIVSR
jgi:hypothetical protein